MTMNEGQTPILKLVQRAEQRAEQLETDIPRAGPPVEGDMPFRDANASPKFFVAAREVTSDTLWTADFRPDEEKAAPQDRVLRLVDGDRVLAEVNVGEADRLLADRMVEAIRSGARERILELGSPEIRARINSLHSPEAQTIAFEDVRALALGKIAEENAERRVIGKIGGGLKGLAA